MSRISIFLLASVVAATTACPCGDGCGGIVVDNDSIKPDLILTPETVNFQARVGGPHSGAQEVSITALNGGPVSDLRLLEVYPGSGVAYWLKVSLSASPTSAVLRIEPATTNLPVGTHHATIYVSMGPSGHQHKVQVTIVVSGGGC